MTEKNLVLNLPFNDHDRYGKAYDYSSNRADGTLSNGAAFIKDPKRGKALFINGSGECLTATSIPFASDFTVCGWVKTPSAKLGWLINFSGINNYLEHWIDVDPGEWVFVSFVKKRSLFCAYIDGYEVQKETIKGAIIGFSINDSDLTGCNAVIDSIKVYDVAKSQSEIIKMRDNNQDVEYIIDGTNFKEYGVQVAKSNGILGGLERKESLTVDYDNYHGIVVDKKRPRYKERTISLDCFIEASNKSSFVTWTNLFMAAFQKPGNQRLAIQFDGPDMPLVYEVYCPNPSDVEKSWSFNDDLMVGTFKLKLIECEPVKRVLRHIGKTSNTVASITVSSTKLVNIYWGDGTYTNDVSGTKKTVTHNYLKEGEYDIVIAGVIEDITEFDTNCIVVWDKLQ